MLVEIITGTYKFYVKPAYKAIQKAIKKPKPIYEITETVPAVTAEKHRTIVGILKGTGIIILGIIIIGSAIALLVFSWPLLVSIAAIVIIYKLASKPKEEELEILEFGGNNRPNKIDIVLIKQFANIQSILRNGGDFYGVFSPKDRDALEILCEKNNSSQAYLNLALFYTYGINVPIDYIKGEELLLKSVEMLNPFAFTYLALLEEEVKHDFDKAAFYLKKGCDTGDMSAMVSLGIFYMNGTGVPVDQNKAIRLWKKAASLGSEEAMQNLRRL